jgi:ABC-2 type transport system ATP-binding protein
MTVIETEALSKRYGDKLACDSVDISVGAGEIFGFLGPNGAGKSTCIKMLTGLISPTSGSATVLGSPIGDVASRRKMGYLPELFRYQPWMTGEDLLHFHSRLFKLPKSKERVDRALKRVGLDGQGGYKIDSYSKGMQQRIGLAAALLPDPELLFLDEPTSALDPVGRKDVRDIILSLRDEGTTVFLNSHLLSEVESVCDSVAIIHHGKVARTGSMRELLESKVSLRLRADGISQADADQLRIRYDEGLQVHPDGAYTLSLKALDELPEIAAFVIGQGARLFELTPVHETLESVFLRIVGEEGQLSPQ